MRIVILCFSLFVIASCMSNYKSSEQVVSIGQEVNFKLISSIPFSNGLSMMQSASATYDEESHDLLFQTEIANDKLVLVGLTPTGTRLFTIIMQQGTINATGLSAMVEKIKPQYLLADLQMSLWPEEQVALALTGAKVAEATPFLRTITYEGKPLISIEYSKHTRYKGSIKFTHHQRGYRLIIEPLAFEEANNDS